ncbi:alpha/beta fold hydrolase [Cupriavidus sp. CuC1]|uniref:alpha/beta fold hydrolase n=1 Tax=Cupriavidus sp. CuC1 TaxID=3373131 RepID=UPI0037D4F60D
MDFAISQIDDSDRAGTSSQHKTYVLVHGGYHGGWCWKEVAAGLRSRGHTVYTPTLTGLGERSHLMSFKPTLGTFIEDIVQVIRFEELDDVILVGHSFAGSIVSGVADRVRVRLRHLVHLDSQVLQSGESPADELPPELVQRYKQRAMEAGDGLSIPPNAPDYFGITDPQMAAWLQTKLTPHPLQTYFDKLNLENPLCNGVPATYIACSKPLFPVNAKSRELAKTTPGWTYLEIPTAHDAMILMPYELTEMLAAIG